MRGKIKFVFHRWLNPPAVRAGGLHSYYQLIPYVNVSSNLINRCSIGSPSGAADLHGYSGLCVWTTQVVALHIDYLNWLVVALHAEYLPSTYGVPQLAGGCTSCRVPQLAGGAKSSLHFLHG